MTKKNPQKNQADKKLRRQAEESLEKLSARKMGCPDMDTHELIHELRVHQIELEIQNEELRHSQTKLESSLNRYLELYDFAPNGYFTLDEMNLIQEVNLTGADMLGYDRSFLRGKRFTGFIAPDFQDEFYLHRKQALEANSKHVCEIKLINKNGAAFHVQLQTVVESDNGDNSRLRIAAIDITERVRSREELKRSHKHLEQLVEARTTELARSKVALEEEIEQRSQAEFELTESEKNIRMLSHQLIKANEFERQKISRELHDRIGQDLSVLKIGLENLWQDCRNDCPDYQDRIKSLTYITQQTVDTVRELAYELRPPGLDQFGFAGTITKYCQDFSQKTGLAVKTSFTGIHDLVFDFDAEINLYRLIEEGLNNIHKHAQAKQAVIKMVASFPDIILRIEDDGLGFNPKKRLRALTNEKRMGLRSMQERAALLGGKMKVQSKPGKGTIISIEVPYTRRKDEPEN